LAPPGPRRVVPPAALQRPFAELLAGAEADLLAVGMILAEQDDQWQDGRRCFRPETMAATDGVSSGLWRACAPGRHGVATVTTTEKPSDVLPTLRYRGPEGVRYVVIRARGENPEALGDRMFTKQRPHEYEHEVRALGYLTDRVPERV